MHLKQASIGAVSAIALIWLSPVSHAAPLSSAIVRLNTGTTASSGIEKAAERVCWLKNGRYWKCRWYPGYRHYRYYD